MPDEPPTAAPVVVEPSPAIAVRCQNSFALCAFANCTVNSDGLTADCGCYSFPSDDAISVIRTGLIPNAEGLRDETQTACNTPDSCFETPDEAPICSAIEGDVLWPGASLRKMASWWIQKRERPFLPGFVPPLHREKFLSGCSLHASKYDNGSLDQVCTCPMVEVTIDYPVNGGLQDPCSTEVAQPGDYVQAAGGPLLVMLESDPDRIEQGWENVAAIFEAKVDAKFEAP
ncbi:MAG: hypothetical protein SGARI_004943 [Bacillariaceae sp.]